MKFYNMKLELYALYYINLSIMTHEILKFHQMELHMIFISPTDINGISSSGW